MLHRRQVRRAANTGRRNGGRGEHGVKGLGNADRSRYALQANRIALGSARFDRQRGTRRRCDQAGTVRYIGQCISIESRREGCVDR